MNTIFKIQAKVWLWPGVNPWHLVTVPRAQSAKIRTIFGAMEGGWRSLPVNVTIGQTRWKTSIFFDTKRGGYLLPLKAKVRKSEGISDGDMIRFILEIRV